MIKKHKTVSDLCSNQLPNWTFVLMLFIRIFEKKFAIDQIHCTIYYKLTSFPLVSQ